LIVHLLSDDVELANSRNGLAFVRGGEAMARIAGLYHASNKM